MVTDVMTAARATGAGTAASLVDVATPAVVIDREKLDRNIARLNARIADLGVSLRPHVKTSKCADVAQRVFGGKPGPITVSTVAEAEHFAGLGYNDITYAVGLSPDKAGRVLALRAGGIDVKVVIDSVEQAIALGEAAKASGIAASAMIEIDCDGHRGGLVPGDPAIVIVGDALKAQGVFVAGVLTHAGESYALRNPDALAASAEQERAAAVAAATALRAAGHECPIVSVGSTPTAHFARDLTGVTEVRAGVYMFFDLVMHGIGVCRIEDIATSVLATVIGHKTEKGWILTDAGWMALSRDRGTSGQDIDQKYGVVCDIAGHLIPDLLVNDASQEHGIMGLREGSDQSLPDLPVGSRVRILPNHACAAGAQHEGYLVVAGSDPFIEAYWPRMRGW